MSWASGLSWGLCRKIGPAEGTPVGKREENSYGGHAGHGNWWQSFDPHPFIQTLPPSKPPKLITDTVFFDDNLMKIQKNIVGRKSTPRFIMERGVPEMNQVIGPKEEGWEIVPSPFQRTVPMDQQVDSKKDHSEFASAVVGTSEEPHPLVKSLKTTASQAGVEQRTSASQYSKMDKEKETQYEKDTRDKGVQFKNETGDKETQYEKDVKEKGTQSKGIPVVKGTFPNQAFPHLHPSEERGRSECSKRCDPDDWPKWFTSGRREWTLITLFMLNRKEKDILLLTPFRRKDRRWVCVEAIFTINTNSLMSLSSVKLPNN